MSAGAFSATEKAANDAKIIIPSTEKLDIYQKVARDEEIKKEKQKVFEKELSDQVNGVIPVL